VTYKTFNVCIRISEFPLQALYKAKHSGTFVDDRINVLSKREFGVQFFIVLPKFDQNNFFQKFKKNLVRKPTKNIQRHWFPSTWWPWIPVDYRQKNRFFTCPLWSPETNKYGFFFSRALTHSSSPSTKLPPEWLPFEIYFSTTWTAPYFDHTYLGFPSIKSNGFFTKTKEAILYFVIITILEYRRTVHALWYISSFQIQFFHGTLDWKLGKNKKKMSWNEL
jgi:hypothetical protein